MQLHIQYNGRSKILKRLVWAVNYLSNYAGGDMHTDVYDINKNGIVDDAEKVNGHSVYKDVPSDAVFTDTVYDDTTIRGQVRANMNNIELLMNALFNQNTHWLIDSDGNQIIDSNGYPIYTAQYTSKLDELVQAITELQSRKYLYWGEPQQEEGE
jgi:hypothetical protein